eukprot:scaffold30339_cov32-Tisochrysis_lutea.AAC.6
MELCVSLFKERYPELVWVLAVGKERFAGLLGARNESVDGDLGMAPVQLVSALHHGSAPKRPLRSSPGWDARIDAVWLKCVDKLFQRSQRTGLHTPEAGAAANVPGYDTC